jgi:hypothetical protein
MYSSLFIKTAISKYNKANMQKTQNVNVNLSRINATEMLSKTYSKKNNFVHTANNKTLKRHISQHDKRDANTCCHVADSKLCSYLN